MSLREQKKVATRRAISEATAKLMLENPDRLPTISQISTRAGISVRTFHNYFADIDEALFEFVHRVLDALSTEIDALPAQLSAAEAMETVLSEALNEDGVELYSASTLVLLASHASSPSRRPPSGETIVELSTALVAVLKSRIPGATQFDAQVLLGAYTMACAAAISAYLDLPTPRDPKDGRRLIRRAFEVLRDFR